MNIKPIVQLHTHSEYSALDGASKMKSLVKKAAADNMPACAITDHGVMNSLVSFYKECRKAGIKPIVGCETYITPYGRSRFDKVKLGDGEKNAHHLVLLAKNKIGAKNLNIICSRAHLEGFYYKPRSDYDLLRDHSEGLIGSSACLGGAIPQALLKGDYAEAKNIALVYKDIFNKSKDKEQHDFYLELQDHGDPKQRGINLLMIELSKETGIPLVGTNDSHFTNREDKDLHDIVLSIAIGGTASQPKGLYYSTEHYFKTSKEMWDIEVFKENPEALINTVRIADKCNYIMELGLNHLPDFPVPEGFDQDSYLRHLTYEGLKVRYDHITEEIKARADYELNMVITMGFPGYLLIVWDFIRWARENGIEVGPGRGSAAGSIICYSIGITDIDPLPHGLLFERFLNPDRISMPDIDVDFCIERRQEVMNYVAQKYGDDKVCQIVTFGTMGAKQAFKDVARVMELPYGDSDRISKLIPKEIDITLAQALEFEDFRMAVQNDERVKKIVGLAQRLEGMVRNTSTHAAGVIISKYKLEEVCPLMQTKEKKKDKEVVDDEVHVRLSSQTQIEQKDAEDLGLLKMDFLGLRNLTMIRKTLQMIENDRGIKIDWHSRDMRNMDDPKVFELIASGSTLGMFQIESDGMTKLVLKMKPSFFGDLSAILALYRPGPLQSKMDELYVDCKHGRKEIEYLHPDVEPFLKDTYGTMIYQEQIMQIAQTMSGYSLGEADLLRRAMGKKKPEEMAAQKDRFINGAIGLGYLPALAESTFEKMARFAEYGFNRAHSAAYAVITYRTAWLKTYYPAEFMSCLMSSLAGQNARILSAVRDCNKLGIKVLPPDVNKSNREFAVVNGEIRFGLLSIKGIGEKFIDSIIQQRQAGPYLNLVDFCKRVHHKTYNSKSLENLIKSGAFDLLQRNRALLISGLDNVLPSTAKDQKNAAQGQVSLFGDISEYTMAPKVQQDVQPFDKLTELEFERELMGIYISGHPLNAMGFNYEFHYSHQAEEIESVKDGPHIVMCGILRDVKKIITKKGKPMAFFQIEDLTGIVSGVIFPDNYQAFANLIEDNSKIQIFGQMSADRDGTAQVILNKARPIEGLKAAMIEMPPNISEGALFNLQKALPIFKGETPVVFHFHGTNEYVVAEPKYWITYNSSFIETVEKIVGKGTVSLV